MECFLLNREQCVSASTFNPSVCPVSSGVPPGPCLGPTLFLIYITDLSSLVSWNNHLFANYYVVLCEINTGRDTNLLQSNIDKVTNWRDKWLMTLKVSKCKVMRIKQSTNSPPVHYLNNVSLYRVSSYKYQGVHISAILNWRLRMYH